MEKLTLICNKETYNKISHCLTGYESGCINNNDCMNCSICKYNMKYIEDNNLDFSKIRINTEYGDGYNRYRDIIDDCIANTQFVDCKNIDCEKCGFTSYLINYDNEGWSEDEK